MTKYLTSSLSCLLVLGVLLSFRIYDPKPIEQIRLISFDYYQNYLEQKESKDIHLLNIGEQSLEKYGQWPWPRHQFAQMISDLRAANAGIIGFTIMYPEPDRFGGDETFKSWIVDNGIVLSQVPSSKGRDSIAPYVGIAILGDGDPYIYAYAYAGVVTNIPELEQAAWGVGMINSSPEIDGIVRRMPLVSQVNGQIYPSLPMELVRANADKKSYTMKVEETGIENFRIPPFDPVKTDYTGSIYIDWSFQYTEDEYGQDLRDLQGKTVLVGVTAEGIVPMIPTPQGAKYPHQIQAAALATILSGKSITRPSYASLLEIVLAGLLSLGIILVAYRFHVLWSAVLFAFSVFVSVILPYHYWHASYFLFDWTFPLLLYIIVFSQASFNNFYRQFKLRQQIKKQFGTYLSPDMVAILQKKPELLKLGGERKEMTFLFMDIVGFTPISEHYKNNDDPEGLVELVNEFLDAMTKIILANGGTIDKYMGDCIMAFWNAPLPCENHAEMAVKSALEIEEKTNELKKIYKDRGLPDINVGTGVNTGDCIVGNMGSESRFDYSVIGDAVNLAARLEATAARHEYLEYKTIISRYTMLQLPPGYICNHINDIRVKGKEELISIYSPSYLGK